MGCSLSSLDGFTGGMVAPGDAGIEAGKDASPIAVPELDAGKDGSSIAEAGADASTPADAGPDAGDGLPPHGPNLLFNGTFEAGCAAWTAYNANASTSATALGGSGGCKVCTTNPSNPQFRTAFNLPVSVGERYFAQVYGRAVAEDASAGAPFSITLTVLPAGNTAPYIGATPSAESWSRVGTLLEVTSGGASLQFLVTLSGTVGSCVIFDDAAVYKLD